MILPRVVVFDPPKQEAQYYKHLWNPGDLVLYLGEIRNMPGHGVYVTRVGEVKWGYHTDLFREPTEEEL